MSVGQVEVRSRVGKAEVNYAYQLFMLFLCTYAIVSLTAGLLFPLDPELARILALVDYAVCAIFFLDFVRSLARAENRLRYLYTWGWLDLLSSIPAIGTLRIGRLARMLRIIRVLRAIKAVRYLVSHLAARPTSSAFYSILAVSFSIVVISALAVLQFEISAPNASIRSADDALWWAMTTITTVGYGDKYPVTAEGRIVAVVLMTSGVGLFGALSGAVAGWFIQPSPSPRIELLEDRLERMQRTLDRIAESERFNKRD